MTETETETCGECYFYRAVQEANFAWGWCVAKHMVDRPAARLVKCAGGHYPEQQIPCGQFTKSGEKGKA